MVIVRCYGRIVCVCVCSGKLGSSSYTAEIQQVIILTIIHSYPYLEYSAEFSISNLFSGY